MSSDEVMNGVKYEFSKLLSGERECNAGLPDG
jgi:hypothetical protein